MRLANFTGPFDLLLQLIGKHKLDVTEVALHQVTDDFIAYIRAMGDDWDLDEASEFLVVAATLLDLKAARLLPAAEVEDEEDLALLEARDLLFARLLQYKAFKEAAAASPSWRRTGARRYPRAVSLEPRYAEALPDLVLGIGAGAAGQAGAPGVHARSRAARGLDRPRPPGAGQRPRARRPAARPAAAGRAAPRSALLIADCENTLEVVARFLALLELYREGLVGFDQVEALGELTVRWTGGDAAEVELDIDEYEGTPAGAGRPTAEPVTDRTAVAGELP